MGIHLPILDISDVPLKLMPGRRFEFCEEGEESALLAEFALSIAAESVDIWEFTDIFIGSVKLTGSDLIWAARHFEDVLIAFIQDHINETLPEIRETMFEERHEELYH